MNDYLKLLEMLKSSQRLVSVFSDIEEPSTCSVGYIHQFDECWMAMAHITPEGFEDGYIFRKIENIFRIDFDGVYEKKVEYLQNQNLKKHEQLNLCSEKGIFVAAMNEAMRTKKMMAINVLGGDDVIGSVYSISESFVTMQKFTDFGDEDGLTVIPLEVITKFNYDNLDLRSINCLNKYKKDSSNNGTLKAKN